MANKENKILVFAEQASVDNADIITDAEYLKDPIRVGGNLRGLAKRAPNNKALKQATLMGAALADYITTGPHGSDVNDAQPLLDISRNLANRIEQTTSDQIKHDSNVVHTSGNEIIDGLKEFIQFPRVQAKNGDNQLPEDLNDLVNKLYVDKKDTGLKTLIGNLDNLTTEEKSNLVEAINEVHSGAGGDFSYVVSPKIISPQEGATEVTPIIDIVGNQYLNVFPTDPRLMREFQIATDPKFTSIAQAGQANADQWETPVPLAIKTKHYARIRDISTEGFKSGWSKVVSFTTRATGIYIEQPVITLRGYGGSPSDIGSWLDLSGSPFTVSDGQEDRHVSTDWSLSTKRQLTPVWESLGDASNLTTAYIPDGTMKPDTAYVLTVTYNGEKFGKSVPAVVEFRTATDFGIVNAPTLSVEGAPSSVFETPTLNAGVFSNTREKDTHVATDWSIVKQDTGEQAWASLNDSRHLRQITVPSGNLEVLTSYIAKVRYKGEKFGWSQWTEVPFSTVAIFAKIATPTISGVTVDYDPKDIFTGSEFTMEVGPEGRHDMSDWIFYDAEAPEVEIFSSKNDTQNLNQTPPNVLNSHLQHSKSYIVKLRYHDANSGAWSDYGSLLFKTKAGEFSDPIVGPFIGTRGIHFIGAASDPNENFFTKATIYKPAAYFFRVWINGEIASDQNIYSLTYPDNADVLIESIDKKTKFPWFNADSKAFFKRFLEPLPAFYRTEDELVLDYERTFYDSSTLTEVPEYFLGNIWQQNGKNISFSYFFKYCDVLKTLPENLFSKNAFVSYSGEVVFDDFLYGASALEAIPENIFRYIRGVTSFRSTFGNCILLSRIPERLFANNLLVTRFDGVFSHCESLTSVPENLFSNNTAAKVFSSAFAMCDNLTSVPINLFVKNVNATAFFRCFHFNKMIKPRVRIAAKGVKEGGANEFARGGSSITVYVPKGSTTAKTFRYAIDANINVIEE